MARWRLKTTHYLNVPGTEYRYEEISQYGKQMRVSRDVPLHLDPDNQADQNYPGEIIVSHKRDGLHMRDIVFAGEPTADMEPLDEEAQAITAKLEAKWHQKVDQIGDEGIGSHLIERFMSQQAAAEQATSASSANIEKLLEAQASTQNLMAQLLAKLAVPPETHTARR